MYGPDGKSVIKMTWESFEKYQRWNEFPELEENPPMTDDFMFWYKGEKYFCAGEDYGHIITDADWNRLAYNKNFLELLLTPIMQHTYHKILKMQLYFRDFVYRFRCGIGK